MLIILIIIILTNWQMADRKLQSCNAIVNIVLTRSCRRTIIIRFVKLQMVAHGNWKPLNDFFFMVCKIDSKIGKCALAINLFSRYKENFRTMTLASQFEKKIFIHIPPIGPFWVNSKFSYRLAKKEGSVLARSKMCFDLLSTSGTYLEITLPHAIISSTNQMSCRCLASSIVSHPSHLCSLAKIPNESSHLPISRLKCDTPSYAPRRTLSTYILVVFLQRFGACARAHNKLNFGNSACFMDYLTLVTMSWRSHKSCTYGPRQYLSSSFGDLIECSLYIA